MLTLILSRYPWSPQRFLAIEERLFKEVVCPDGEVRTLTGQPDLIVADPPENIIIVDLKFGRSQPPRPRDDEWERDQGKPYLSERGHYQLDAYSMLALQRYPQATRCTLREVHIRIDEDREAFITREEMEHVERRMGVHLQRLDEMLRGEREPEARPGHHCHHCLRPHECPIAAEDRGLGAIQSASQAKVVASRWGVADAMRDRDGTAIKGWLERDGSTGIELTSGYVGWKPTEKNRRFGLHPGQVPNHENGRREVERAG